MMLKPAPVSTRQFTYHPSTRSFSAEMSETNGLGRVWDDSCDDGLTLVSTRTGRELVFVVNDVTRDREGDVLTWELSTTDGQFHLTLFND